MTSENVKGWATDTILAAGAGFHDVLPDEGLQWFGLLMVAVTAAIRAYRAIRDEFKKGKKKDD